MKIIGASILPLCIDPVWGCMYFLLGKERRTSKWVRASELWSGFGGRPSSSAEPPESTAAREFVEETAAMVKYFDADTLPRRSHADIAESLRRQQFILRCELRCKHNARAAYVVYVTQIPWDPQCLARFVHCRARLADLVAPPPPRLLWVLDHPAVTAAVGAVHVNKDFFEKQALGLWSVPQMLRAVRSAGILSTRGGKVERCRPSFVQLAAAVLAELAFLKPDGAFA